MRGFLDTRSLKALLRLLRSADFRIASGTVVLLFGCLSGGNQETGTGAPEEEASGELHDAAFYRETGLGQTLYAYLHCEEFDCTAALQAVIKTGPDAVPPLLEVLADGMPPDLVEPPAGDLSTVVRTRAISALGLLGDNRALNPLIRSLEDSSPLARASTAEALGRIGGDPALAALLPLLRDSDELVRERTAIALQRFTQPEALSALRDAANAEPRPHVRRAMEAAIRAIKRP